ncbi:tryptophan dimethylallyltransferase family protein [Nannocystis radixulma]|uniref:Tryptophan dimethylallyltransferase family protein n=1 Tax=Nannocystis radixulma TaxID=2995305 RepID=A0ABT5BP34_9BACT|nr:tryptophan dimethylallyltransferase family protein [Nannocystis radixulma]MDC0675898.1 tryptophan dimethylallyltransferase family protein [Nannocystis radixulma]
MTDLDDPDVNHERAVTRPHHHVPVYASTRYPDDASYLDVACDKLRRAAVALDVPPARQADMTALLRRLCRPWGDAPVARPRYWSNVSLEGMPFELSYAWGGGREWELRMSFETLAETPTPEAGLDVCRAFTRRLADEPGAGISRYLAVEDLFVAPTVVGMSPMAHGISWTPGAAPGLKIYLNPNIAGYEHGVARTSEAMERLGLARAWRSVCDGLAELGVAPRPVVVAMDLSAASEARVKIYLPHLEVDAEAIDRQSAIAANHVPGAFAAALRRVTGHTGPAWRKVPVTCLTLVAGDSTAAAATLYVPLNPDLADDAAACAAVSGFVREAGGDPSSYAALLHAIADRPLTDSATHNFVSFRPGPQPRFAVYLAPGVYRHPGGAT